MLCLRFGLLMCHVKLVCVYMRACVCFCEDVCSRIHVRARMRACVRMCVMIMDSVPYHALRTVGCCSLLRQSLSSGGSQHVIFPCIPCILTHAIGMRRDTCTQNLAEMLGCQSECLLYMAVLSFVGLYTAWILLNEVKQCAPVFMLFSTNESEGGF